MKTLPSIAMGQKFNKLTYVQSLGINEKGHSICEVRCECGKTKVVKSSELVSGHIKTCGCGSWCGKSETAYRDIVGKKFGQVTIIKMTGTDEKKYRTCLGRCDCGETKT